MYVAWRHIFGENIRDMAVARSEDGGRSFSAPTRVHVDNWRIDGCPHSGPSLAVDDGRRLHVSWYTGADGKAGVYYAASDDAGQSFGPAESLQTGIPVAQIALAANASGIHAVYNDPMVREVRMLRIGGGEEIGTERGHSPALVFAAGKRAISWKSEGGIRLRIERQ